MLRRLVKSMKFYLPLMPKKYSDTINLFRLFHLIKKIFCINTFYFLTFFFFANLVTKSTVQHMHKTNNKKHLFAAIKSKLTDSTWTKAV